MWTGVCVGLVLIAQPVVAQEYEVRWLGECQSTASYDPSLLSKKSVPPGADCSATYGTNLRILDTRIGVEWPLRQTTFPVKTITATRDPLEYPSHKACVLAHLPDGAIIDEWIVPRDVSCEGRKAESPFFRRYRDGKVCLMPNNICIEVERLDAKGKDAVARVIQSTLATRRFTN